MEQYPATPIGTQIERNGITLTMTEEGWRAEVQHTMMRRCKNWDYCKPWIYMVTIGCQHHDIAPMPLCIPEGEKRLPLPAGWKYPEWLKMAYAKQGRPHLFGELEGESAENAHISLNALGKEVDKSISDLANNYPQLRVLEKIVMPNHIHMVIWVKERLPEKMPLGIIMNRFKSWVNRKFKEVALELPASTLMDLSYQQGKEGNGVPNATAQVKCYQSKTGKTGHGSKNPKIGLVFEAGFHDRILFRKGQLENMKKYCLMNPHRLWQQKHNKQYFERVMNVKMKMPYLMGGGTKGQRRWNGTATELIAPMEFRQNEGEEMKVMVTFNITGNRNLLSVPEKMQIQCSRSACMADIEQMKEEVLEACMHGVIPISPCISPGEKAIARAVLDSGNRLIVVFPNGIPLDMRNKAGFGQYFEACARGQLLILSPWEYKETKRVLQRWQCLLLNDIAAQLSIGSEIVLD